MGRGQPHSPKVLYFENEGVFTTGFTFGDSRSDSYWSILLALSLEDCRSQVMPDLGTDNVSSQWEDRVWLY